MGKSSLLNRFLGEERALVSAIAGTTRDAVDGLLEKDGKQYLFVDTAGIRRARHLKENVDHVSVVLARRSLERADVAILLLDAVEGLREMDAIIGGHVQEAGRAVVIAVNKWDLADESGLKQKAFREAIGDHLKFLPWAPDRLHLREDGQGARPPSSTRPARAYDVEPDAHHHRPAQPHDGRGGPEPPPEGEPRGTRRSRSSSAPRSAWRRRRSRSP